MELSNVTDEKGLLSQTATTDADALMQAYLDEFLRLDCPPECPLLTAALDCECIGNIAGAMAALKRHRGSATGALCCYGGGRRQRRLAGDSWC